MKDVMLDLETLGTKPDAMIIQIGACYFDRHTSAIGDTFKATIRGGLMQGFSTDYDTIKWWMEQSDAARASVMAGDIYLPEALLNLQEFLRREEDVKLWSHATFDAPILESAFRTFGIKNPVPFRNMRDIRTLMDIAGGGVFKQREGVHHDALDDAKYQAAYVSDAIDNLRYAAI